MSKFLVKRKVLILLLLVLLIAVFFRGYKAYERFEFAHDGDIYSWIVKDIVAGKHLRLIGQETSQTGVFIGSGFYYLLVPFFVFSDMKPTGVIYFGILLSLVTILSYFYIFKKLINNWAGLIAAFLQSVLLTRVLHDRWIVPTNTMFIWEIWFFYSVVNIAKGNFFYLPVLGFLAGLIWHISLAEAPLFLSGLAALILSKKIPNIKEILKTGAAFLIPSVALFLFELRHNFMQFKAIIGSLGGESLNLAERFSSVLAHISSNINGLVLYPERGAYPNNLLVPIILTAILSVLIYKKFISKKTSILILVWIISMILFFTFSKKGISEYYFTNIETIYLVIIIFALSFLLKLKKVGFFLVFLILSFFLIKNFIFFINIPDNANFGYKERQEITSYIIEDSKSRGFPCVGISYITSPGNQFGFRYVFLINNLKLTRPSLEVPVYNIVLPFNLSEKEIDFRSGVIGVIKPKENNYKGLEKVCKEGDTNITESLWGYVD